MGMVAEFKRIKKEKLDFIRANPETIYEFVNGTEEDESKSLYLDKAWDAINFLINGRSLMQVKLDDSNSYLQNCVISENVLAPDHDLGYGPASYVDVNETKEIFEALQEIGLENIKSRYDARRMDINEVYPQIWVRDKETAKQYVFDYLEQFYAFYKEAA